MNVANVELAPFKPLLAEKSAVDISMLLGCEVYLINDDFTPMEFVADLLKDVFKMDVSASERVTMRAHFEGKALCGIFSKDVAQTMACDAMDRAHKAGHPLLFLTSKMLLD